MEDNTTVAIPAASNTWASAAPYPHAARYTHAWTTDGFIYVIGGLTAADEILTKGYRYDPASTPGAPVLVFFSALGTPAKVYRHVGQAMAQQGVHFCAPDWRGIDSSSVRASRALDFGYRHLVELDMAAVVAVMHRRFPDSPVWVGGHSVTCIDGSIRRP